MSDEASFVQKKAHKQKVRLADYKRVFSTEQGKRVLYDMMSEHFVMKHTYVQNDPMGTAFNEGQRQVMLRIFAMLKADPLQVEKLMKESHDYATTI